MPAGRTRLGRILLVVLLVLGWLVAVPLMWHAVTTVPSAARLQAMSSRIMHPPGPATFLRTAGRSLAELLVLVALLWPGWRRLWLLRLLVAFVGLFIWAVVTMPLELTELEQIHHQWLVGCDLAILLAMVVTVGARLVEAIRDARSSTA